MVAGCSSCRKSSVSLNAVAWRVGTKQGHQAHSLHHHGNLDANITNLNHRDAGHHHHHQNHHHHQRHQPSRTWAALPSRPG